MVKDKNWDKPRVIFQHEYSSILETFYENVLRSIVQYGKKTITDKDVLDITLSDIKNKMNYHQFKDLPVEIKNAYTSFKNFVQVLKDSKDEEVVQNLDVMSDVFDLLIACTVYGNGYMSELYFGRNPCRKQQYKLYSSLNKAKKRSDSPLLRSVQELLKICSNCPYKAIL